jgi:hypothetical protein
MEKVKEEVERVVSELIETEFSIKVLVGDLPEKAVFQPSYAFSFSPSMSIPRPHVKHSLEEDMVYLYEVFRDGEIFKVNKDFSIEVDNLKELFDNSIERKFVWDLKRSGEFNTRNIIDVHVKKDGSYSLKSFYDFSFCEERCLKEKLSSQSGGKIVVYLQKSFLFEVPELDYLVNELHFIFPKGKLVFGKKSFYEASDESMFCYLYLTKPVIEIKVGRRRREK